MQLQPVICNFPAVLLLVLQNSNPNQKQLFYFVITIIRIFGFLVGIQDILASFSSLGWLGSRYSHIQPWISLLYSIKYAINKFK